MKAICIKEYDRFIHEASKYKKLYDMDFHVKRLKVYDVIKVQNGFKVKDEKCSDKNFLRMSLVSLPAHIFYKFFQIIKK